MYIIRGDVSSIAAAHIYICIRYKNEMWRRRDEQVLGDADHVCARTQKDARESGGSRIDARAERIREERV